MQSPREALLDRLHVFEDVLESELAAQRRRFRYNIRHGRVVFEAEAAALQRRLRKSVPAYIRDANPLTVLTSPVIYSVVLPLAVLDAWVSLYQAICFPIYGITKARRRDYLILDRALLPYLNPLEKMGCFYCSYANGLIAYVREVAARTEEHFCPIKHARRVPAPHSRYHGFADYGDAPGYRALGKKPARRWARARASC